MMKYTTKISAILLVLIMLTSCSGGKVLKTKELSTKITQTSVVVEQEKDFQDEFSVFLKDFKPDFTMPGLFEGAIPQGFCYIEWLNQYAITAYYEDGAFPSVLMLIDAKSGKLTASHTLKNVDGSDYIGHAGGAASSEEYLFITSESTCYTISLRTLKNAKDNTPIQFEANFKLNTAGSFATYSDGVLWTGTFVQSSDKDRKNASLITTLDSGETFYAYCEGYILKDGLPDVKSINSTATGYIPDYMLAIPEQVQGFTFTQSGKLVFSTSYGRTNNSVIYIFDDVLISERAATTTIDGVEIDILACSSELLTEKITALPMAEGITRRDGSIYIIFESGAAKYRSGGGKYPTDKAFKATIE